jgi:hypothetical protein
MVIIYVVTAPLMIMMGLLPGKPLGFEKWLRRMFVVLIVFPATALLICCASLLAGLYATTGGSSGHFFAPPFVGYPDPSNFGWLIAFGMIMVTPHLLEILEQNMGTQTKSGGLALGAVVAGSAVGAGVAGAVGGGAWKTLTRTDPYSKEAYGPLAKLASRPGIARFLSPILKPLTGWDPTKGRPGSGGGHN